MKSNLKIGFLGAGQMARALAVGFVQAKLVQPDSIYANDAVPAAAEGFLSAVPKANICNSNLSVVSQADVIFLAVKPQHLEDLLAEVAAEVSSQLLISIAAGKTLNELACRLPKQTRLVRVMPNTPCLVGESASCYALGGTATSQDRELVQTLLSAVGKAWQVDEKLLDAVTGLSGSGPAFVYLMIEALSDGGVRMGLPRELATQLAAQTVKGAADMVLATGEHPGVLKDRVASPGGTTIAGLHVLESNAVRGALIDAVQAATLRSKELAG